MSVFRFAPSPNGYLHLGHALSALLNFDMARTAGGRFLLRIEDIDATRCRPEFEQAIYEDLQSLGVGWERPVRRQSEHLGVYRDVVERLTSLGLVYPAFESRGEIARLVAGKEARGPWPRDPDGAPLYPGSAWQFVGCGSAAAAPDPAQVRDILAKSMAIKDLTLDEVAVLIRVNDKAMLEEMRQMALDVKLKVYDNRIVTFAPLYLGNYCVNRCTYCGFNNDNESAARKALNDDEIRREVEVLAGKIGHKRLIVVYGEHPKNDVDYIVESLKTIYAVKVKTRGGTNSIRRINVNAPPFSVADLKKINDAGIGTYQVFQETYHKKTYARMHPANTIKGNYHWRLYAMHRAMEAGIDDVGIGALFGLYDWRFELLSLIAHTQELERKLGIGAHTISFPRVVPALNSVITPDWPHLVSDVDFKKIMMIIRLAVPYTGMIVSAREKAEVRNEAVLMGVTQMDASSQIAIGGYSMEALDCVRVQEQDKQQFILGDTRSLDELIRDLAQMGFITSFCTAGYRCGRTGKCIMDLLRSGAEGKFCKLNAVLTFQEWLDDFATNETKRVSQPLIEREIAQIKQKNPQALNIFMDYYARVKKGERDLYL